MKMKGFSLLILGLLWPLMQANTFAQLHEEHSTESHLHEQNHKNHLALFNGATTNLDHGSTAYTIGLEHEYRISKLIGSGSLLEYVAAEHAEIIIGLPFFIHPHNGLKIIAAPLIILGKETNEPTMESRTTTDFAFRIGFGYDFHLGAWSFGPDAYFDYGHSKSLVYGLSIGLGF